MKVYNSRKRLQYIILTMSMLVMVAIAVGGWLHYNSLRTTIEDDAHAVVEARTAKLAEILNHDILHHQMAAAQLAVYPELARLLKNRDHELQRAVTATLSRFADALGGIAYLMDTQGVVVADSPRAIGFSIIGNNYAFRPYFRNAVRGKPALYLALGKTTKKRGIYYSQPITDNNAIVGVVVIKMPIDFLDRQLQAVAPTDSVVLLSPEGIIFSASRADLQFKSFWKLEQQTIEQLRGSLQMGPGPWLWAGYTHGNGLTVYDRNGNEYVFHEDILSDLPGWEVAYLHNVRQVINSKVAPPMRIAAAFIFFSLVGAAVVVSLLYKEAIYEIDQRRRTEEDKENLIVELRQALDEVKTLRGIIPICSYCKKIRDDAGAWNQLEVYISRHSEAMFSHGICPQCMKKHYDIDEADG